MNRRGLGTTYDNSRYIHYFSQSLLNTFLQCPEQARHELLGDVPRIESPKMALGTAGHAAIEAVLRDRMANPHEGYNSDSFDHYAETMMEVFEERMYLTEFKEDPKLGMEWARRRGVSALSSWWEEVLPQLDPELIEQPFEFIIHSDSSRQIYMKGTIDLVDTSGTVWDWKFSGSERKVWKDQRGSIQAAAYTRALTNRGAGRFKYAVMHEQGVQIVELVQDERHWAWLAEQCLALAYLIEGNLPAWPKIDSDWWCNVNWCPVFADKQCKGAYFPEGFGAARNGG